MKIFVRTLVVLITSLVGFNEVCAESQHRPNILILYADDFGYGDLACQNPDSKIPTPTLDELASQGIRFTDGHCSSGICTPSRYALLTGRYHWRKFHSIVRAFGASVFDDSRLTLPEMLQQAGYQTAAIGKWHLGWDWEAIRNHELKPMNADTKPCYGPNHFDWSQPIADGPLAHGFDHYFGDTVINFPPYCWIEDDRVVEAPDVMMNAKRWKPLREGKWECRPGPMIKGWNPYQVLPTITQRAAAYITERAASDQPFFLYFALPSPHAPIVPNEEFNGSSQAGAYGDFVVETDDACGKLLKALEESGQAENTIVIFTSDNGPEHYAYHRDEEHQHWSSGPYRGLKRDIYEGGHHVPFLVRWPGVTELGQVSNALVSQIDLMATLAAVVGQEIPEGQAEDSINLVPLLRGETDSVRSTHVHNTYAKSYALRHENWVLIDAPSGYLTPRNESWEKRHVYSQDNKLPVELYDLEADPGQMNNLAAENPARVLNLKTMLNKIRAKSQ